VKVESKLLPEVSVTFPTRWRLSLQSLRRTPPRSRTHHLFRHLDLVVWLFESSVDDQGDEKVLTEVVDFGTRGGGGAVVEHVFEGERVQVVVEGEGFDDIPGETVYLDVADLRGDG
jgi:hypothetical protein